MILVFKNGPPEAVRIIFFINFSLLEAKHWCKALCSLSTGSIEALFFFAKSINRLPHITKDSLFANKIFLPDFTALIEDSSPADPDIAQTTISTSSRETS